MFVSTLALFFMNNSWTGYFNFSFEWGIVEKRVEKLNVLMLIHEERHIVLYVLWHIFTIFENPHLIPNRPLVANITVTLMPCKLAVFWCLWNYPLILTRFKYLEIIGKCVILSIALAKPGTIFPVVMEITRTKKVYYRIKHCFLGNYLCINPGSSLTNWIKSEGLYVKFVSELSEFMHT
jgi:hypothetical protein